MTRVLIPTGALGLGYDRQALAQGIANRPDIIAVDGGSTDSGPAYLGRGVSKYSASSTRAEWRELMLARAEAEVPLVIGTVGTCGADSAVDWLYDITTGLAAELGQRLKIARLYSGQDKATLKPSDLRPLSGAPDIAEDTLTDCTNIVALAGAEQLQVAIQSGADIIIAGRATDTAVIAALPLMRGDHAGAAWHGAKVGECGAIATDRPNSGVIEIDFDATGFTVRPLAKDASATPYTVSAHMLYENADPFILYEPGGYLDVTDATYTSVGNGTRVEGSRWVPGPYNVKLEGARLAGYQTVSLTLLRDPRYVSAAQVWADDIVENQMPARLAALEGAPPDIELRLVGQNATLGPLEHNGTQASELGVLAIVTAQTQAKATEVAKLLNPYLLHHPLTPDEPMPTFAFAFSPPEMERGPLYEFCLHHTIATSDPMERFRLVVTEVGT